MTRDIYSELINIKNAKDLYNKKVDIITTDNIDLTHYIFSKLTNDKRSTLLKHLEEYKYNTKTHLLIDIDDTIYPGGIGGTNVSYKTKKVYPFFIILYNLFINKNISSAFITILTARPRFLRNSVIRHFNTMFKNFDVLSGKSVHLLEGAGNVIDKYLISYFKQTKDRKQHDASSGDLLTSYPKMGHRKYESYKKYSQVFPEYNFIFIGDSGQGDIDTSILMMKNHANVKFCFIHNIIQIKKKRISGKYKDTNFRYDIYSNDVKTNLTKKNIFFFDTYLDVFQTLYDNGYMNDTNKDEIYGQINKYMNIDKTNFKHDILYNRFIKSISKYKM